MELFYWMHKNKVSGRKLAKVLGIHGATLSNFVQNKTSPSLLMAMKISFYTKGQVKWETLLKTADKKKLDKFIKNTTES